MKKIFWIYLAASLFGGALALSAQIDKNLTCPVMPGTRVNENFFVDWNGQRVYLCCKSCVKAFKKHPERYLKNLKPQSHS